MNFTFGNTGLESAPVYLFLSQMHNAKTDPWTLSRYLAVRYIDEKSEHMHTPVFDGWTDCISSLIVHCSVNMDCWRMMVNVSMVEPCLLEDAKFALTVTGDGFFSLEDRAISRFSPSPGYRPIPKSADGSLKSAYNLLRRRRTDYINMLNLYDTIRSASGQRDSAIEFFNLTKLTDEPNNAVGSVRTFISLYKRIENFLIYQRQCIGAIEEVDTSESEKDVPQDRN